MEKKEKKTTPKKEDKTTPKKADKKKKVVKETVEKRDKEIKSALPNDEPFGIKFKRFVSSYKFLYSAFIVLFIVVIVLACLVFTQSNRVKANRSNIVFSIMDKNTNNYINLELAGLVGQEYTLKVTNFRNNKINKSGAEYTIDVTNDTDVQIEILKDGKGENLMTDQKHTVIEGDKFGTKEKESVVYHFRVTNSDKIKEGDSIRIEVDS